MEEYHNVEAARLYTDSLLSLGIEISECCVSPSNPSNIMNIRVLRESNRIFNATAEFGRKASRIYHKDIRARHETDGRLIDIAMPVRFSGGIKALGTLTDSAEDQLSNFERTIDDLNSETSFDTNCSYGELARVAISLDRKMIERTRLYLHAYLWMLWTLESLEQADQIFGLMLRENRFSEMGKNAFAYVAHPPILVSILSCTAMIEEVGAMYVNQLVAGNSVDPDNTRAIEVLESLPEKYQDHSDLDLTAIGDTIVASRNDISHYLSKRPSAVTPENLDEHVNQGLASIRLVGALANELLSDVVQDYENRVLQNIISNLP